MPLKTKEEMSFKISLLEDKIRTLGATTEKVSKSKYPNVESNSDLVNKKWDIAIILNNNGGEMNEAEGDSPKLIALINKLSQAIQAYFDITGEKLNVVVVTSRWLKDGRRDDKKAIRNCIGIQRKIQNKDVVSWYDYNEFNGSDDVISDIANLLCLNFIPANLSAVSNSTEFLSEIKDRSTIDAIQEFCKTIPDAITDASVVVYYIP